MMILHYSHKPLPYGFVKALLLSFGLWFVLTSAVQALNDESVESAPQIPVAVSADELIGDESSKSAEFIGNVKVVRGEYTLIADRLKIFFDELKKKGNKNDNRKVKIQEIIAVGNVRILSNELTANADRAIYDRKTRTLVLSGKSTEVHRKGQRVMGEQITIFIGTERVEVTGNSVNRVKGVFTLPEKN
jgi:lipopolysaccharide export system protein LptA